MNSGPAQHPMWHDAVQWESYGREASLPTAADVVIIDYRRAGTFLAARSEVHEQRARADVAEARTWGDESLQWLPAMSAARFAAMDQLQGGTFTPHCASIQPAKLVTGLARVAAERGVTILERVRVTAHGDGVVITDRGSIAAKVVVRATEGYTGSLRQHRRQFVPVYSLMLATEPLAEDVLDAIALPEGITFADYRHVIIYGQRTADNRIAFGGRGAPYHFGSATHARFEQVPAVHRALHRMLLEMFPQLTGVKVTHTWGGALALPRDWTVSVGYDRERGFAWSGGYLGDGVTMSFTGGRILAELISGKRSALCELPWVGHTSRQWEPEPLRWLGISAALRAMHWADSAEERTGRASRIADLMNAAVGRG
ncbi:MAG: FAD-dependent oxidoreductase [Actinobacteria bacterium]|nr:FAD-dependent oxidoreductase [Actinomycetota bacterium]